MNHIIKHPAHDLRYTLSGHASHSAGDEELALCDVLQRDSHDYRPLDPGEIECLRNNGNYSPDWKNILVHEQFDPQFIRSSRFFGPVRIGLMEDIVLEHDSTFHHVGIWDSTIISCHIGGNPSINSVSYLAHYVLGEQVIIQNAGRIHVTSRARFGQGVLRQGEDEASRSWIHVGNENGNRRILAFDGMLPADAYIWSRYRDDPELLGRMIELTDRRASPGGICHGTIGDQVVIRNVNRIVDAAIGCHALIDGALRLENTTISSREGSGTKIGEGCDLKDGVVGCGCSFDRGVKAERFMIGPHVELDMGARVRDVFIGDNASIHCCEVTSVLTFPGHTQHHNNSFLIASTIQGLSNVAAGATIGSNHNSRSPDGELIAGRGFWAGLNTSFKFPSQFAAYTLVANGVYPHELDIRLPFSLVSNNADQTELQIMPAYWFLYNMYGLRRNEWKYSRRDRRRNPLQPVEYGALAPDTVESIFEAMALLEFWMGRHLLPHEARENGPENQDELRLIGFQQLMKNQAGLIDLQVPARQIENSQRPVRILKAAEAYQMYRDIIRHYAVKTIVEYMGANRIANVREMVGQLEAEQVHSWVNLGGHPVPEADIRRIRRLIIDGKIGSWDEVHDAYQDSWDVYPRERARHALGILLIIIDGDSGSVKKVARDASSLDREVWNRQLSLVSRTERRIVNLVVDSRARDHEGPFRSVTFGSDAEGDAVLGSIEGNAFICDVKEQSTVFIGEIEKYCG